MSIDSVLDGAVTTILAKAQREAPPQALRPGGLDFQWGGGGQPLDALLTDPMLLEVPFNARIVWAHLYALDGAGEYVPVTATVEVRLRESNGTGASTVLYGSGLVPALSAQGFLNLDITGWQTNLLTGDAVTARLVSLVGVANLIVLAIQMRPTDSPLGATDVVDAGNGSYVDASGNVYVIRS